MTGEPSTTALERAPEVPMVPMPVMSEGEIQRTWRVAKALAASRFFKDARQAEAAFAKILLGRDLGLSPTEAMSALHVFDGKVEASADFHATRVKKSEEYDYAVAFETGEDGETAACSITFFGPRKGEPWVELGVSRFSLEDAGRAGLLKKDNWKHYPRNMLFARAMSNGVAWYCPEVMGGQRVYAPGEAQDFVDERTIGGAADGDDVPGPLHEDEALAARAEAVIVRAEELGHAGLANRGATAMALRGQAPERVEEWLTFATTELDKMTEPEDATVVEDEDDGDPVPADVPESEAERDAASTAGAGDGDATQGALEVD